MPRARVGTAPNSHFGELFVTMLREAGIPANFIAPLPFPLMPSMPGDIVVEDDQLLRFTWVLDTIDGVLGGYADEEVLRRARAAAVE